jgi:hypothetical protein
VAPACVQCPETSVQCTHAGATAWCMCISPADRESRRHLPSGAPAGSGDPRSPCTASCTPLPVHSTASCTPLPVHSTASCTPLPVHSCTMCSAQLHYRHPVTQPLPAPARHTTIGGAPSGIHSGQWAIRNRIEFTRLDRPTANLRRFSFCPDRISGKFLQITNIALNTGRLPPLPSLPHCTCYVRPK